MFLQQLKKQYILYMTNMYCSLFFMTFYDLGLDKKPKLHRFEKV
ncbi:hypothetical protein bcere0022_23860 [Bacillus cereus Rock3-44]|nr:hypothetical protein bcere0022_23860 [Bacillus cereus Rock3-44]